VDYRRGLRRAGVDHPGLASVLLSLDVSHVLANLGPGIYFGIIKLSRVDAGANLSVDALFQVDSDIRARFLCTVVGGLDSLEEVVSHAEVLLDVVRVSPVIEDAYLKLYVVASEWKFRKPVQPMTVSLERCKYEVSVYLRCSPYI
jgi:hypothetical protein